MAKEMGLASKQRHFSLLRRVQTGSKAHPASYPAGTGDPSPGGKVTGVKLLSTLRKVKLYFLTTIYMYLVSGA
jgi:hypothetical protein